MDGFYNTVDVNLSCLCTHLLKLGQLCLHEKWSMRGDEVLQCSGWDHVGGLVRAGKLMVTMFLWVMTQGKLCSWINSTLWTYRDKLENVTFCKCVMLIKELNLRPKLQSNCTKTQGCQIATMTTQSHSLNAMMNKRNRIKLYSMHALWRQIIVWKAWCVSRWKLVTLVSGPLCFQLFPTFKHIYADPGFAIVSIFWAIARSINIRNIRHNSQYLLFWLCYCYQLDQYFTCFLSLLWYIGWFYDYLPYISYTNSSFKFTKLCMSLYLCTVAFSCVVNQNLKTFFEKTQILADFHFTKYSVSDIGNCLSPSWFCIEVKSCLVD